MDHINRSKKQTLILFIGILLIGASLRAPITSVGIALPSIKETLNLSNTSVSLITIIPLLSFAVISLFAAKISHKFGLERTVFGALILICIGIALRAITGVSWLYVGTILIGVGIAFGNVLTPGIIKMNFPLRIGIMTGYYTVVMNIFGSASSYVTAPLVKHFNYNIAISLIGIVTFIGIILIGIASGLAFGLVNTFFGLRTENGLTAAKLSGMSQSVGYLFAAIGPLLFGILHDATNSWNTSFGILLVTSIIIMIIGSRAGRNITIEQTLGARH